MGLFPSVDWNFFHNISAFTLIFSASVSETLALDVRFFYLSVFRVQLFKSTPIILSFFFSSASVCKLYKVIKCSFSISVLYLLDAVGTKHQYEIVSLWSSGKSKKPTVAQRSRLSFSFSCPGFESRFFLVSSGCWVIEYVWGRVTRKQNFHNFIPRSSHVILSGLRSNVGFAKPNLPMFWILR